MSTNAPYHYRWECPAHRHKFTCARDACDFCLCFLCKTDFVVGCQTEAHRWAHSCDVDVWPPLFLSVSASAFTSASNAHNNTQYVPWLTLRARVPPYPGPQCAGVPDAAVREYLREPLCDGATVFLLKPEWITPAVQPLARLLAATSCDGSVTRAMIGNNHHAAAAATTNNHTADLSFGNSGGKVRTTMQIVNGELIVRLHVAAQSFLVRLAENSLAPVRPYVRGGTGGYNSSSTGGYNSSSSTGIYNNSSNATKLFRWPALPMPLHPFQATLLRRMITQERSSLSTQLWHLSADRTYISSVGDWVLHFADNSTNSASNTSYTSETSSTSYTSDTSGASNQVPEPGLPSGGAVCMPPCSGKTRVVAALIAMTLLPLTIVVVPDADAVEHWTHELELAGLKAETQIQNLMTTNSEPTVAVIVPWQLQHIGKNVKISRIVYDDISQIMHIFMAATSPVAPETAG